MLGGDIAFAQQSCSVAGVAYSSGASSCQSAVRDGRVEPVLFTCADGARTSTDVICPDQYAYFCRVGPHAVAIGERLLVGAGPASLECEFPGNFRLNQGTAPLTALGTPSVVVRSVQMFLSDEGEGLDCAVDDCAGQSGNKTLSAGRPLPSKEFRQPVPRGAGGLWLRQRSRRRSGYSRQEPDRRHSTICQDFRRPAKSVEG